MGVQQRYGFPLILILSHFETSFLTVWCSCFALSTDHVGLSLCPSMGSSALQTAVTSVPSITSDDSYFYGYRDPYGRKHLFDVGNEYGFALLGPL